MQQNELFFTRYFTREPSPFFLISTGGLKSPWVIESLQYHQKDPLLEGAPYEDPRRVHGAPRFRLSLPRQDRLEPEAPLLLHGALVDADVEFFDEISVENAAQLGRRPFLLSISINKLSQATF